MSLLISNLYCVVYIWYLTESRKYTIYLFHASSPFHHRQSIQPLNKPHCCSLLSLHCRISTLTLHPLHQTLLASHGHLTLVLGSPSSALSLSSSHILGKRECNFTSKTSSMCSGVDTHWGLARSNQLFISVSVWYLYIRITMLGDMGCFVI